ncbi:F-box domain-containing protein [Caenorhabditis elegans]|uniref:F-box domain-containing protein n=1 Tax=Caenorhabditis elegans TaxID=6239 RepID=Q9N3J7_CAEEL|nr:F-box domain-containing protein [Caenorhabditis elegans]CCD72686.1 F-box domain-containing protein [Caenorhabditis elegans]|eukprot:NP_493989.1 F-box B protein [Caenorhabditis elegans]
MSTFPLLRLPQKTLKNVILHMGHIELICASLLSNKTKHFIREFCIFKAYRFNIVLDDSVRFGIASTGIYIEYSFRNGMICIRSFGIIQITMTLRAPQFDAGSWLVHLLNIFNPSKIDTLSIYDSFDVERLQLVKESLNKIPIFHFEITATTATNPKLFSAFLPIKTFGFNHTVQYNSSQLSALRPALPKKLESIYADISIPLNELLLTCSRTLQIVESLLTDKDINLFLKHWMAGLKPELEYLYIRKNGAAYNPNIVLEGIHHEFAPIDRKFRINQGPPQFGGIDIHQTRGGTATMTFNWSFGRAEIIVAAHALVYFSFEQL